MTIWTHCLHIVNYFNLKHLKKNHRRGKKLKLKLFSKLHCVNISVRKRKISSKVRNLSQTSVQNCTHTVRKVLADFALCNVWRYCKALCDVRFSQVEENGRKFRHIELSKSVYQINFLTVHATNPSWNIVKFRDSWTSV